MTQAHDRHDERRISARDKSFPASAIGRSIAEFTDEQPHVDEFATPLLIIDDAALRNNIEVMAAWIAERGLELMPHGKTTMAPALWQRQIEAGATGITVATTWQARVALSAGVGFVMLANECVDPVGLTWIADHLDRHPGQSFVCWADSLAAVELMDRVLVQVGAERAVGVLAELGGAGGRTGARTLAEARTIAEKIAGSPRLTLLGVAGYEGAIGHDRSPAALTAIRTYLERMVELHGQLSDRFEGDRPIISAAGSAFFDLVADALGPLAGSSRVVLRSGAYITHDSGFYASISPLAQPAGGSSASLQPATWGLARVLSRPEPGLALLDGGKRDFPYDEGLPVGVGWRTGLGGAEQPLAPARVSAMNDQHSFLRVQGSEPPVGAVVRLGLSHPCTTFDKWRLIPVVDPSGVVIDVVETHF